MFQCMKSQLLFYFATIRVWESIIHVTFVVDVTDFRRNDLSWQCSTDDRGMFQFRRLQHREVLQHVSYKPLLL
jgi:hypothetical protein